MKQKLIYGAVIIVVVGTVLAIWGTRSSPNNANFPEGTDWLCLNQSCNNHFKLTIQELGEHHKANYGQPVKCPKCGQRADRADVCKSCGKVYIQMRGMQACPFCGKPLAPPAAG